MPDYSGAIVAAALIAGFFALLFGIAAYVISSFFLMRIFERAGVQGKWRAWVPVYNLMVFSKLGDVSPWWILIAVGASIFLSWIDVINWIIGYATLGVLAIAAWRVGLKQGNKEWYYLLLWLVPGLGTLIWLGIVAFDKSPWNPNIAPAPWAGTALADKTVWSGIPVQPAAGLAAPPAAYSPPPGYEPPPGYGAPPAPPTGYAPPPPAGYTPPPPAGYTAPPPATERPATEPPATEPRATDAAPTEPPAAPGEPKP